MKITSDLKRKQESFAIHPVYGEFTCRQTEHEFQLHHLPETFLQLRMALAFFAAAFPAYALAHAILMEQSEISSWFFMICLMAGSTYGSAACATKSHARKCTNTALVHFIAHSTAISALATLIACQLLAPNDMIWHAMLMSLMLFVIILYLPCSLIFSLSVSAFAATTLLFLGAKAGSIDIRCLCMTAMFLFISSLTASMAAHHQRKLRREEYRTKSVLTMQSIHDPLTGCYNRRHLSDLMESELARAKRQKHWLTVILCDLDHFKKINDMYGHPFGDNVLKRFASLLLNMTREHVDSVVRYGGEEFLLVLSGTDMEGGKSLAERLRTALSGEDLIHHSRKPIPVTASFGVVSIDFTAREYYPTQQEIILMADELLYKAKHAGRNHIKAARMK